MQIRDATISDIPHLAALFITAFSDDPDYETAYPWRSSAPDDYAQLMTAEIMQMFLKGQGRLLVVETEQRQVVAWACWTRKGSSAAAGRIRAENDSLLKVVERTLYAVQEAVHYPFIKIFSLQPSLRDEGPLLKCFFEVYGRLSARLYVGDLAEHWLLQKLCVDPGWRRQGIATILLNWGLDRAREEGVAITLNSTRAGVAMYVKAGFVQVATCEVSVLDIQVPVMVWRPEAVQMP